jgi:broad specificity phosphatase PhoE
VTEILLVRHGETDWNAEQRWQGHADRPLNERGREQARTLARQLSGARLAAVYSSDLARARETAEIVAAARGLAVTPLQELREVNVGSWSGLRGAECEARFPEGYARWRAGGHGWEDGETYEEMSARVVGAVRRIAARHPGETVLVVTHGGAIRSVLAHAAGLTYGEHRRAGMVVTENCGIVRFAAENGAIRRID